MNMVTFKIHVVKQYKSSAGIICKLIGETDNTLPAIRVATLFKMQIPAITMALLLKCNLIATLP